MAKEHGSSKRQSANASDGSPQYGEGKYPDNPYFPDETMYEGPHKAIVSPHGSIFAVEVHKTNAMEERLKGEMDIRGKHTHDYNAPRREEKGRK